MKKARKDTSGPLLSADLILMDTQLLVLGGYDATRQIAAGRNLKEPPIIAVSSLAMKGDEEKARAARCELSDTYGLFSCYQSSLAFAARNNEELLGPVSWCAFD